MKHFVVSLLAVLCMATVDSAQLPTDPNTRDAWFAGQFEGVRVFYEYSSKHTGDPAVDEFVCRVDYYHDGRIRLLAVEAPVDRPGAPFSITTFYSLEPAQGGKYPDTKLVRTSYQQLRGRNFGHRPVISAHDTFSKYCVLPTSQKLLVLIPSPEAKMFRDQYGDLFGIKQ